MKVTNYRELIVWQKSIAVAKQVYLLVKKLPKELVGGIKKKCSLM